MAETLDLALRLGAWIEMLEPGAGPTIQSRPVFPDNAQTLGLVEAPRGMLGHWVALEGGRIASYQVVSPTTWFASPRDSAGVPGPLEQALVGLEVADPANPIEALRVIHSFDPCMQCSVH
jgi:Ni,Fe-hydrogenase I large subunit